MTLEDLRVFVAACEAGSLSALAQRLERTQPAVSQHIARLETELGAKLFERHARGVELTAAGQILKECALVGLDAIESAVTRIRSINAAEPGELTITTGSTTVRHFLKRAVVQFRRSHPHVNLHFLPASSTARCLEIMRMQKADLAFVTTGGAPRGIREHPVLRQHLFLLVPATDPLARSRRVSLRTLKNLRYLGLATSTTHHSALEHAAGELGITLRPEVVLDDFDTAKIFVELGMGHAIVPAVHAHNFVRAGGVRAVLISDLPPVAVGWAVRSMAGLSRHAQTFMQVANRSFATLRRVRGLELLEAAAGQDQNFARAPAR